MSHLAGLENAEVLGDFDFPDGKMRLEIAGMILERKPRTVSIIPMNGKYQARCSPSPVQIPPEFSSRRRLDSSKKR
jgi:hypothetical protein